MNTEIEKIFVPSRLFIGIGALLVGLGICVAMVVLGVHAGGSLKGLGIGAIAAIAGAVIAATSRVEGCASCKAAFESTFSIFGDDLKAQLTTAISSAQAGQASGFTALEQAPLLPVGSSGSSIELEYCPKCEALGRAQTAQRRYLPDGQTLTENLSAAVVLRGKSVAAAVNMLGDRNKRWAAAAYR